MAGTAVGSWVFARALPAIDRLVLTLTRGRTSMTAMAAGLPVISLQTVGVKTGLPRTALLMGIPYEGRLAIAGANFGQAAMPAWVR
ncbi:MAG: nitroreductase family deazaflavin-dependent oxidoreductase, partial [Chloroflexi bacterium]|nr:nitroreductase family deazaflavin-dependent oxidoreductase [Chloroflexota bacterium]